MSKDKNRDSKKPYLKPKDSNADLVDLTLMRRLVEIKKEDVESDNTYNN